MIGMRRDRPTGTEGQRARPPQHGKLLHGVREHLRLGVPTPGRRAGSLALRPPRTR